MPRISALTAYFIDHIQEEFQSHTRSTEDYCHWFNKFGTHDLKTGETDFEEDLIRHECYTILGLHGLSDETLVDILLDDVDYHEIATEIDDLYQNTRDDFLDEESDSKDSGEEDETEEEK